MMKLMKSPAGNIYDERMGAIFAHCNNGLDSCALDVYFASVEPVLVLHGITSFEYDWIDEDKG